MSLLLSPQVDEFIIRSSNKTGSLLYLKEDESTRADGFILVIY